MSVAPQHVLLSEHIARLRKYAEDVRESLPGKDQQLPGGHEAAIEAVRRLADEVIRESTAPVRIGVVGGFSAGKSLLLGALIGNARVFPVEARPTTGNIAAVRLRAEPGLERTEIVSRRVEWLDRAAATDCVLAMLERAGRLSEGLPDVDRARLAQLRAQAEQRQEIWGEAMAWAEQSWDRSGAPPNPSFRGVLRELTWFARCCSSPAGKALLTRLERSSTIPDDHVARAALLLPAAVDLAGMAFAELPRAPARPEAPEPLTEEFVRSVFPLVRRVDLDVRVPAALWDLAGRPDSPPFLLLDSPGLGASQSGARDTFLCKEELREVQTILIVLSAASAGSAVGNSLFGELQETRKGEDLTHNILVVVNRFDEFPNGAPDPQTVREADLERTAPSLHQIRLDTANLTRSPGRVVFASAMYAVERLPPSFQVVPDTFQAEAVRSLRNWYAEDRERWERLADELHEASPRSVLAEQLRAVVFDGGLARLKARLAEHVSQHGLKQLCDSVLRRAEELREAYRNLPRRPPPGPEGKPGPEALREEVRALRLEYDKIKSEFDRCPPSLSIRRQGKEETLYEVVKAAVCEGFWDWGVWSDLFNNMHDGRVSAPDPDPENNPWAAPQPPEDSMWFFPQFREALNTCLEEINQQLGDAVPLLLESLARRVRRQIPNLSAALLDPQVEQRVRRLTAGADLLRALREAADPSCQAVREPLLRVVREMSESFNPERCYALPGTNGDPQPLQLGWGSEPEPYSDLSLATTLRTQLILGARFPLLGQVQRINQRVGTLLKAFFNQCLSKLQLVLNLRNILEAVAGSGPGAGTAWKAGDVPWPFPH
jgi:hypothetical protein